MNIDIFILNLCVRIHSSSNCLLMKKIYALFLIGILVPLLFEAFTPGPVARPATDQYIVIAWNDLGMHCANKDFSNLCILPPYNNQSAYVIKVGSESSMPQIMLPGSSGIHVDYSIPGNTYSGSTTNTTKTNFWVYAQHIFGVTLPADIGLAGIGISGAMADSADYFHAQGIPVTPYPDNDLVNQHAYQLTLMQAYDAANQLLASTQSVIPVSNEISCVSSGCHNSEMGILYAHESVSGFNIANKPILCANCHADPALGMQGTAGVPPFSQVIHQAHGSETNDCYKCHPGPNTQCFRDTMKTKGLTCQTCHGSVSNVGNTIANGRTPWLQEPQCGAATCHGSTYAEEPGKLFRQSRGHGGLFCSTCHGSPHAIYTSQQPNDNLQIINLQGEAGILKDCNVCHGYIPASPGPHGYNPLGIKPVSGLIPESNELLSNYPNPCNYMTNIPYRINKAGKAMLEICSLDGKKITTLVNETLVQGEYKAEFYSYKYPAGIYLCMLTVNGEKYINKIIISR
jgi:hypothetical protein